MWKTIQQEPNYEVSSEGKVRNKETKHVKSLRDSRNGYLRVTLYPSSKTYNVHRLVALTFISKGDLDTEVNHIDGVKHNNKCDNLEWCTSSHNQKHAFRLGLQTSRLGIDNKMSKLSERQVRSIRFSKELEGLSNSRVADMFKVSTETIRRIRKNILWKHIK